MGNEEWNVETLPAYQSRSAEEIDWLWSAALPSNRDNNPVRQSTPKSYQSGYRFYMKRSFYADTRSAHNAITPPCLIEICKRLCGIPLLGFLKMLWLLLAADLVNLSSLR